MIVEVPLECSKSSCVRLLLASRTPVNVQRGEQRDFVIKSKT
jgi:hypothetical protein